MSEENKQPTPQDPFEVWQKYFEEQQKVVLNYWTAVLNSMWGTGK